MFNEKCVLINNLKFIKFMVITNLKTTKQKDIIL